MSLSGVLVLTDHAGQSRGGSTACMQGMSRFPGHQQQQEAGRCCCAPAYAIAASAHCEQQWYHCYNTAATDPDRASRAR
jgi:hypothetical protein